MIEVKWKYVFGCFQIGSIGRSIHVVLALKIFSSEKKKKKKTIIKKGRSQMLSRTIIQLVILCFRGVNLAIITQYIYS